MITKEILNFEEISFGLKHKRLYMVAKESGVSYPVLKRLAERKDENFKLRTLKMVSRYIIANTLQRERQEVQHA